MTSEHQRKPVIAIVGRPNVGKSTLFNRLVGRKAAIVQDFPGVTRDRQYRDTVIQDRPVSLIDTGGFEPETDDLLLQEMRIQAEIAIHEADTVIIVFDGRSGLLPADEEITRMMQRSDTPVHFAVNKVDGPRHEPLVADFYALGVEPLWTVSAEHGGGVYDLMEAVMGSLPELPVPEVDLRDDVIRIAVVGKPNAGKSTLINQMLGEQRLVVSDIPGTTRDSIDTWLELPADLEAIAQAESELADARAFLEGGVSDGEDLDEDEDMVHRPEIVLAPGDDAAGWIGERGMRDTWEEELAASGELRDDEAERLVRTAEQALARRREPRRYLVIDTAGVRRRKWIRTVLERYSVVRAFKSIDRAEVCLLVIDATHGVTEQDVRIAGLIDAKGRACVILVNKWDAVEGKDTHTAGAFAKEVRGALKFIRHAPIVFISAKTGQRVHRILGEVDRVRRNSLRRVRTADLNRLVARAVDRNPPAVHRGRRLRFYYASQVSVAPPTFLLALSDAKGLHFSYERYLANRIREAIMLEGTPIRFILRDKQGRRKRS